MKIKVLIFVVLFSQVVAFASDYLIEESYFLLLTVIFEPALFDSSAFVACKEFIFLLSYYHLDGFFR